MRWSPESPMELLLCAIALMVIVGNFSVYNVIVLVVIGLTIFWMRRRRALKKAGA
jgi:hypothetical protein